MKKVIYKSNKETEHNITESNQNDKMLDILSNQSIDNISQESDVHDVSEQPLILGEYFNIHTFKKHPITIKFINNEAQRLKVWADTYSSLRLCDFYNSRGYSKESYRIWTLKYPQFAAADEYARQRCGSRREHGALTRQFSESMVSRTLGFYDDVFREEMRLVNEARRALDDKSASISVTIKPFEYVEQGKDNDSIEGVESIHVENDMHAFAQDEAPLMVSDEMPEDIAFRVHRRTGMKSEIKVGAKAKKHEV